MPVFSASQPHTCTEEKFPGIVWHCANIISQEDKWSYYGLHLKSIIHLIVVPIKTLKMKQTFLLA